jgi:hypothetical protein
MNSLFNEVLANISEEITPLSAVIAMALSLLLGGIIAFTYRKTQDEAVYQRSLAITLVMLPIILSVIILFIGSNIARAFSLAGTLSIIRFRSAPGDAKDIGFIFFDIAAGLACGVGMYAYGVLFVVILCLALIILEKANMFQVRTLQKTLKITIPENLNYSGAFEDILDTYTKSYTLTKIKTTDLGSLFELVYRVSMADGIDEQQFLNELRTRNGNLTIMLCESPKAVK